MLFGTAQWAVRGQTLRNEQREKGCGNFDDKYVALSTAPDFLMDNFNIQLNPTPVALQVDSHVPTKYVGRSSSRNAALPWLRPTNS